MTITTMLWATNGVGDAPTAPAGYTAEQTQELFRDLVLVDETAEGVAPGEGGELEADYNSPNLVQVATGAALINGIHLKSDAQELLAVPGVAADTAGIVVARVDYTGQVGSMKISQQASGNTTKPNPQQDGAAWEIELGSYIVASNGIVYTDITKTVQGVTDLRGFYPQIDSRQLKDNAVDTAAIQDNAVTNDKLATDSVSLAKMQNNSVDTPELVDDAVTNDKLATDSVSASKIQDYAVWEDNIMTHAVSGAKCGDQNLIISERQGGTAGDWDNGGTTNYTITDRVEFQAGARLITFSSQSSVLVTVTFPHAFVDTPVVIVTPVQGTAAVTLIAYVTPNPSTTQFSCYLRNPDGLTDGTAILNWLAIGNRS